MSRTKNRSSAAKKVAIFFIVIMIIEILALVGISRVFKNDDVTPSFAGYSVFLMDSNRMVSVQSPDNSIPKNALVLVENHTPSSDKIGKAVLCENVPGIGTSVFWLSDIVSKGDNVDGVIYMVYQGDDFDNIYEVRANDVVGVASSYYETAGKVIKFVTSYIGMAACIVVPLILLLIIELIIAIASRASSSHDDDSDYYDEDDEPEKTLEDFLNEREKLEQNRNNDYADDTVDEEVAVEDEDIVDQAENDNGEYAEESPEDDDSSYEDEASQDEVQETDKKSKPRSLEDSVSSTRQTASASLEELMKMMEEEQQKLKDQLK